MSVADPFPPAFANDVVAGDSAIVQPLSWSIVNCSPPIVTLPLRARPVFAATDSVTDAFPVPEAAPLIVIHGTLDVAVHGQSVEDAVRFAFVWPPAALRCALDGLSEKTQPLACWIETACDPTLIVALRAAPLFALTVYEKVDVPDPDPDVMPIHVAAVEALHRQFEFDAVTSMRPVAADAEYEADAGDAVIVHPPSWVTASCALPAVTFPERAAPVFEATV